MARSGEIYGGAWGRTRTESLHVSCSCGSIFAAEVHRAVNVTRDPALGTRLRDGTLLAVRCPSCGSPASVEVPVVVHDETRRLMVLVLPPSLRHRELEERAELLLALARDRGFTVPAYARDFRVVFGRDELANLSELTAETDRLTAEIARRRAELAALAALAEHEGSRREPGRAKASGLDEKALFGDLPAEGGGGAIHTVVEDSTNRFALGGKPDGDRARDVPSSDAAASRWLATRTACGLSVEQGEVRLFVRGRPAGGALQVRFVLHRLPSYPLLVVAVGPGGLGDETGEPAAVALDIERAEDRQGLGLLTSSFHLVIDFFDEGGEPAARREVVLPLAANVRHGLTLAGEHLNQIPAARRSFETAVASFRSSGFDRWGRRDPRLDEESFSVLHTPAAVQKALGVVAGWSEPDNEEYLLCRRSFPLEWWHRIRARVIHRSVELGLVLPGVLPDVAISDGLLRSRKELVTRMLEAFAELVASREGKNDLDQEQIAANWRALFILCDEEGIAVDGRVLELARGAGLGQLLRPPLVVIQPREKDGMLSLSDLVAQASGLGGGASGGRAAARAASGLRGARDETGRVAVPIESSAPRHIEELRRVEAPPTRKPDLRAKGSDELLELLDDQDLRLGAALELCRRVEPQTVGPVFGALRRMTRGEAVRLVPALIKYGERAVPHLVDGLSSGKAYLRQGCALALGILKSADGIDALCELLLHEPTEVWREVARALGEIGGGAVMTLAARLRDPDAQDAESGERIAWALAYVVARGSQGPVESLAAGRDPVAAVAARRALEVASLARDNDAEVRGAVAPQEQTVNRAFSRRFFEAMEGAAPRPDRGDPSSGSVSLDDQEILEADEELIEDEDILPS